jgi:pyridoxal phosphate enzyme (YggS family)
MISISSNIVLLKEKLPSNVTLVAVSKNAFPNDILEAYSAGQRIFGENRADIMASKRNILPPDIEWHFIGHLQANKVKKIASFAHTIHSVDSIRLLRDINKEAAKYSRIINVLLEIHIAKEANKHGFDPSECFSVMQGADINLLENIRVCGLMCMATNTDDKALIRDEFRRLRELWLRLKEDLFGDNPFFTQISMGMTADYEIAVEEGATMVRIGSLIFGK